MEKRTLSPNPYVNMRMCFWVHAEHEPGQIHIVLEQAGVKGESGP